MIRFVTGDMFASKPAAIAHGCNCAGAMGAGIAVEFRTRWETMYQVYADRCRAGTFRLGDVMVWTTPDQTIFNLGTQKTWRDKADIRYVEFAIIRMLKIANLLNIGEVVMPRIGAGLGGLSWTEVRDLMIRIDGVDHGPTVMTVVEDYVKGTAIPGLRPAVPTEYEE